MPYANKEEAFDELTLDYDTAKNDMLALERGEFPTIDESDDHDYIIRKLSNRMRKPDFRMLDPQIQANYQEQIAQHKEISSQIKLRELRLQQGLIPTGGYLVVCDFYATNAEGKTKRVKLPYDSLNWLLQQLQAQGSVFGQLAGMQPGARADIFEQLTQGLESKGPGTGQLSAAPVPDAELNPRSGLQLGQLGPTA